MHNDAESKKAKKSCIGEDRLPEGEDTRQLTPKMQLFVWYKIVEPEMTNKFAFFFRSCPASLEASLTRAVLDEARSTYLNPDGSPRSDHWHIFLLKLPNESLKSAWPLKFWGLDGHSDRVLPSNFWINENRCVFNNTIKAGISCSWRYAGTSTPRAPHLMVSSMFLFISESNIQYKVEGPFKGRHVSSKSPSLV